MSRGMQQMAQFFTHGLVDSGEELRHLLHPAADQL